MSTTSTIRFRDLRWTLAPLIASWALALVLYPRLPDRVPTHWNAAGRPDGWGPPLLPTFLFPAVMLGLVALFAVLPAIDPRAPDSRTLRRAYLGIVLAVLSFLLLLQAALTAQMLGAPVDVGRVLPVGIGLLFAGIGLALPRLGPNWFAGIRTPWTMEDDRVWEATHRVGGKLFFVTGVVVAAVAAITAPPWSTLAMVAGILVAGLGSVVYSYVAWRRLHRAA